MTERPTHPNRCDPFNDPAGNSEAVRRRDFARRLTREVFGRFYWNDRLADELRKSSKKRE